MRHPSRAWLVPAAGLVACWAGMGALATESLLLGLLAISGAAFVVYAAATRWPS